jgi:Gpi18-like mannosyltransferase
MVSLESNAERVFLAFGLLGSLALRLCLFEFLSGDMKGDMLPWSDFIRSHGGFGALRHEFSNYTPLYLYLLTLATYLPLPRLYAIKTVYCVFDYVMAWYVAGIVRRRRGKGFRPWAALLTVLFLPTVVFNSSLWGQCDAMYAAGLAACVHYLLGQRHVKALVAFSLAFSLKPQAVFLAPLLLVLVLQRRFSPLLLYLVPAVYLLLAIPVWLAGRPLADILLLYANQRILPFPSLTLGATNLYQWLTDEHFDLFFRAGLVVAAVTAGTLVFVLYRRYPGGLSDEAMIQAALVSLLLMPYLLPAMHERYFFAADMLALGYAFWFRRGWIVALLVQTASFFTYLPYLFEKEPVPRPWLALVMGAALVIAVKDLVQRPGPGEDRGGKGTPDPEPLRQGAENILLK